MSILRKSFSVGLCAVALACASVGASAATVTLKYEEDANYRLRVSVDADLGSSSQFKSVSTGNLFMNVNDVNGTDQFKPDTSILAWCLELLVPLSEENAVYNVDGSGTQSWLGSLQKLVNQRYTATQYALFSSLIMLPGKVLGFFSGHIVEATEGYATYFVITAVVAVPALVLFFWLKPRVRLNDDDEAAATGDITE